ncbi:hypothetical protein [Rhodococcus erythropolis]|uniref:hypothetical protein n=1 Tax=Rhodococcus erythropolis TaxID=1833 RepID=UPI00210CB749|nr:hypothetical protein [Rhodococcus erythropolis]
MTVIIFARATNGYVLASDGRTCRPGTPAHILTDKAKKIRIYPIGAGGFVTASSGRATIGGASIAEVERSIFDEHLASEGQLFGPDEFAQSIADAIEKHNSTQKCVCSTNKGMDDGPTCVMLSSDCATCGLDPGCEHYEWYLQDEEGNGCPCAPFDEAPASTPSKYPTGCRCRAREESPMTWICVPFGLNASEAVIATIAAQYHPTPKPGPIDPNILVDGELAGCYAESDTLKMANAAARPPLSNLEATTVIVLDLLRHAYEEAPDNTIVKQRDLADRASKWDKMTIRELADGVRKQLTTEGKEPDAANQLAGVAGIGGTARVVVIESGKRPEILPTDDNYGLPVTVCPIHPHGPCPPDLQA